MTSILNDPGPVSDLAVRWERARRAALRSLAAGAEPAATELELLELAIAVDPNATQKAVFDNSLALGRSFRRFFGVALTLGELPALLPQLQVPCCDGVFRGAEAEPGLFLLRQGCAAKRLGPDACDVWREAINGLLLGLTTGLCHSRHASAGHGDDVCIDVVHREGSRLRYAELPADLLLALDGIVRSARAFDPSLSVEFLGLSEGALHYRLEQGPGSQLNGRSQLERRVRQRFPQLSMREVSPRPVMSGQ